MITNAGKDIVKKYFGGQVSRIGGAIALGVGTTAAALTDTELAYEVVRVPVSSINADLAGNRIVFKALVPAGSIGTTYEMGLYSDTNTSNKTKVLSLVSQARGIWANGTLTATNARADVKTVQIDVAANGTKNADISGLSQNLSNFVGSDAVVLAFQATANISSVRVRLGSDASNYYELLYNAPPVGYNIMRANLSTATVTGSPSWAAINYLAIRPSASASGAGSIFFDSLTIEDNTTPIDNFLVVRNVLATPRVMDTSLATNVELSLGITV